MSHHEVDVLFSENNPRTPQPDEQELELCRVCANPFEAGTMFRLFDDDALAEIFLQVSGIGPQDGKFKLPKSCCQDCKNRLREVEELRGLCQESDRKLRDMIGGRDGGTTIVKLEILQLSQSFWEDSGIMDGSDIDIEEEIEEHIPVKDETVFSDEAKDLERNVEDSINRIELLNPEDVEIGYESNSDNSQHETLDNPKSSTQLKPGLKPKKRGRKPKHLVPEPKKERKKRATKEKHPKIYQCASCGRIFKSLHALKEHETTHSSEKLWKCHLCPKDFGRRDYYVRHIKMHETEGQFKCNECDKSFHADKLLQEHIRIKHIGDRPFKCQLCPSAAYARGSSLYAHVKIVHEKRQPFKCDTCLRTFYTKNCLDRHKNRHKGVKTSQCPHCDKRYESNNYLQQHIAERHPERAQNLPRCRYCGIPYSTGSHYRKHVAKKHPESSEEFEQWLKARREATIPA